MAMKRGSTSLTVAGSRQRPSAVAYGRSSRPLRSSTCVETPISATPGSGGRLRTYQAPVSTAAIATLPAVARMMRTRVIASLARDFDDAGLGAAEAIGPVHVLDMSLRKHVAARRHRPHHVGHRKHRGILGPALEGRAEAIVAELRMHRRLG